MYKGVCSGHSMVPEAERDTEDKDNDKRCYSNARNLVLGWERSGYVWFRCENGRDLDSEEGRLSLIESEKEEWVYVECLHIAESVVDWQPL